MKFGIRAKLFLISLGVIVVSVVVAYAYSSSRLERELTERVRAELIVRAKLVALGAESSYALWEDKPRWHEVARDLGQRANAEVTLIRRNGEILGDSNQQEDPVRLSERSEVRGALALGGASPGYASVVDGHTLIVAVPFSRADEVAGVARVALPLTEVDEARAELAKTLSVATALALAAAIVVSTLAAELASRTARSLTEVARRMAGGDLSTRARQTGDDEFGELGRALDQLAKNLSRTLGELREERDRLGGILAGMQEGVLLLDRAGHIYVLNPSLREMLLVGPDSVGKTVLEVVRHTELKELLDQGRRSPEPVTREIDFGSLQPRRLLVRAAQLPGDQGGLLAVFVDVTEVRRLESMRREFVANVSHELRTPVTAVRSAAETLQNAAADDPVAARAFIGIIERNAERLHDLVEDLLDLSRIESRGLKLTIEPLDVDRVYDQVLSLFSERAAKRGTMLENEAQEELPRVLADRRALEHVLTNLVDNAVKYCPNSTIRLRAIAHEQNVELVVEDNGPGIEARHLPRLFERFYRVDAGRSRDIGGTGLGLSIVKHMVEAMGGSVRVESKPGVGTKFGVVLKSEPSEAKRAVA
ncbi:MAG TPA: ATP-binding protein [Polyangiaceae bacterium]|nr:ATP-binding protein [Polyangiaceae bacterium]